MPGPDRSPSVQISRVDWAAGTRETVVEDWRRRRFNSPHDVIVARDGAIWFTGPSCGYLQGFRPEPVVGDYVYRHDPATVVADSLDKPNGIALSPDEHALQQVASGVDIGRYTHPGSNGLALDSQAQLTICELGNRRVVPPFSGGFAARDGQVTLVTDELEGPAGLAFSPDECFPRRRTSPGATATHGRSMPRPPPACTASGFTFQVSKPQLGQTGGEPCRQPFMFRPTTPPATRSWRSASRGTARSPR